MILFEERFLYRIYPKSIAASRVEPDVAASDSFCAQTSVYVLFLVMTRCTYVSTNFGGLRPTYSYVGLRTKMSVSCTFCVLQRGSWVCMVVRALTPT
jgi:hypothetical protein